MYYKVIEYVCEIKRALPLKSTFKGLLFIMWSGITS